MVELTQSPKVQGDPCKRLLKKKQDFWQKNKSQIQDLGYRGESTGDLKIAWKLIYEIHSDPVNICFEMTKR